MLCTSSSFLHCPFPDQPEILGTWLWNGGQAGCQEQVWPQSDACGSKKEGTISPNPWLWILLSKTACAALHEHRALSLEQSGQHQDWPWSLFLFDYGMGCIWRCSRLIPGSALRNYSWQCLCRNHIEPGSPCARQAPFLLYYPVLDTLGINPGMTPALSHHLHYSCL